MCVWGLEQRTWLPLLLQHYHHFISWTTTTPTLIDCVCVSADFKYNHTRHHNCNITTNYINTTATTTLTGCWMCVWGLEQHAWPPPSLQHHHHFSNTTTTTTLTGCACVHALQKQAYLPPLLQRHHYYVNTTTTATATTTTTLTSFVCVYANNVHDHHQRYNITTTTATQQQQQQQQSFTGYECASEDFRTTNMTTVINTASLPVYRQRQQKQQTPRSTHRLCACVCGGQRVEMLSMTSLHSDAV